MQKKVIQVFTISVVMLWIICQPHLASSQSKNQSAILEISTNNWPNPFRSFKSSQEGTPYLFEAWSPGKLETVKGQLHEGGFQLKYNLLHGRLLVLMDGEASPRMIIPIHIKSFSLLVGDSAYTFRRHLVPINDMKTPMDQFFIELVAGEYFLLSKPGKQAQKEEKNILAHTDEQHNVKYVDLLDLYVQRPDGTLVLFKNNKKVRATIFGDQLPVLEKFTKQHKLKWGKTSGLAKIVERANAG